MNIWELLASAIDVKLRSTAAPEAVTRRCYPGVVGQKTSTTRASRLVHLSVRRPYLHKLKSEPFKQNFGYALRKLPGSRVIYQPMPMV